MFIPFISFILISLFLLKNRKLTIFISIISSSILLIISALLLLDKIKNNFTNSYSIQWINISTLNLNIGIISDPLSSLMFFIVATISFLVVIYSIGYMNEDPGFNKFFAFIYLFIFSMNGIIFSNNILQLYIFWELVGLSSYLLIGFWYHKPEASSAAKKAFVVNRVGDLGFFIGILLISYLSGSFDLVEIEKYLSTNTINPQLITIISLLLFCGTVGKSAQFPLHVWLPDAMEGPTPVSALIHAATMVAAGVYMLARLFFIFSLSPTAMNIISYTGAFTAFFAATIAITQNDIKKILAYSTISQLGYMVLSIGSYGYTAGIFHLFTHAFFKALLFLGAGSTIHSVHTNDIWKMGGLYKKMPITAATMLIACLAISGIFPFSGFWSKDEILIVLKHKNYLLYLVAFITSFITTFYMFRLYSVVFLAGKTNDHAHESPSVMTIPLIVLAIFSALSGFISLPSLNFNISRFIYFKEIENHDFDYYIAIFSNLASFFAIALSISIYKLRILSPEKIKDKFLPIYKISFNKYYIDEIYLFLINNIFFVISEGIKWFDKNIVDGLVNLVAYSTSDFGELSLKTVTGYIQNYIFTIFLGILIFIFYFIFYGGF